MDITKILTSNNEFFSTSDIVISFIRWIVFTLVKGIAWVANICQEFYQQCFKFLDFTTYEPVKKFLGEFKGAIVVVLAVSIFIIGYMYMFNKEKKSSIVTNFMIGIFVICSSATLLTSINKLMIQSNTYISSTYSKSGKASANIISSNFTDLIYIDKKVGLANMKKSKVPRAELSDDAISSLDFNEVVKPDSDKLTTSEAKDILKKKLVYVPKDNGSTGYVLEDIKDGLLWTDLFSEYYYRYSLNYFTVTLTLLSLIIVFLVMGYKVIRLIWELVTSYFLAYIFSGEIASGQATKRIIELVKNVYIVLLYTMVSIKLYLLAVDFVNREFSPALRGIVLLCVAFAVIDGPLVIEKILGIDAGLQSGIGKLIATMHMVGGATRFVQNARAQGRTSKQLQNLANAFQNGQGAENGEGVPGRNTNENGGSEAFQKENNNSQNMGINNFGNENSNFMNGENLDKEKASDDLSKDLNSPFQEKAFDNSNLQNVELNEEMSKDVDQASSYMNSQNNSSQNMSEELNQASDWKSGLNGGYGSNHSNSLSSMDKYVSDMNSKNGGFNTTINAPVDKTPLSNNSTLNQSSSGFENATSGMMKDSTAKEAFDSGMQNVTESINQSSFGLEGSASGMMDDSTAKEAFDSGMQSGTESVDQSSFGLEGSASGMMDDSTAKEAFDPGMQNGTESVDQSSFGFDGSASGMMDDSTAKEAFDSGVQNGTESVDQSSFGFEGSASGMMDDSTAKEAFDPGMQNGTESVDQSSFGFDGSASGMMDDSAAKEAFDPGMQNGTESVDQSSFGFESAQKSSFEFDGATGSMRMEKSTSDRKEDQHSVGMENLTSTNQVQHHTNSKTIHEALNGNRSLSTDTKKTVGSGSGSSKKEDLNFARRENLNMDFRENDKLSKRSEKVPSKSKRNSKIQKKFSRDELNK